MFCNRIFSGFAQFPSIGIKGGVNFAKLTSNDGSSSFSTSTLTTFNVGAFVDLRFGNISLQPALNYTGQGGMEQLSSVTPTPSGGTTVTTSVQAKLHLYYLQLPVDLVFHIPVIVGNIYFGAGPYIAEGLSGKTTYSNGDASQKVTFGSEEGDVKPTQFGVNALVGFKLKGGLLINANYDLGLSNDANNNGAGSAKARVFGVSVGYVFL